MKKFTYYVDGALHQSNESLLLNDVANAYKDSYDYPILLANVNSHVTELNEKVLDREAITFLTIQDEEGFLAYQRTLLFILIASIKKRLGLSYQVKIKYSLNHNIYGIIKDSNDKTFTLSNSFIKEIKDNVMKIIKENIQIKKEVFTWKEGISIAKEMNLLDKVSILTFRSYEYATFYKIGAYYDYLYGPMVLGTRKLSAFDLHMEDDGFLLQLTNPDMPNELFEMEELKMLRFVYQESRQWANILKADTVASLNKIICEGRMDDFIRINEALHEKKISDVADKVSMSNKQLVLVAGPSSSGKTTFAHRLKTQLNVFGKNVYIISVDNYFNDYDMAPLDEEGNPDFENLYHVNLELLNNDLNRLLKGEEVTLPFYDFAAGVRRIDGEVIKPKGQDIFIVEGIHALNDEMTFSIDSDKKFKIFISALNQINIDNHTRISATDNRLFRRLVRDHKFRSYSAARTINIWHSVTTGERKHIFPYQEEADIFINSSLLYELSVLKMYAEPLLFGIGPDGKEYGEARRLLRLLDSFVPISPDAVPSNSILTEFIGGSSFNI